MFFLCCVSEHRYQRHRLLILIPGISDEFEILEEFLALESMSGTSWGCDLKRAPERLERFNQPRTLNMTTVESLNLTGKDAWLSRRIKNWVKDDSTSPGLIFLHCIFHQESPCKSVLQLDHVTKTVVKPVKFSWARGLNHC